jgi:hypothetical protein
MFGIALDNAHVFPPSVERSMTPPVARHRISGSLDTTSTAVTRRVDNANWDARAALSADTVRFSAAGAAGGS